MKTKKILSLLVLSFLTLNFVSCKKEKQENPTKYEMITKHIWNWDKTETYEDGVLTNTDNKTGTKMEFNKDYSLIIYKPDGSQEDPLKWDINVDETKLFIMIQGKIGAYFDIEKINEDEFIFSYTKTENAPIMKQFIKAPSSTQTKNVFYLSK